MTHLPCRVALLMGMSAIACSSPELPEVSTGAPFRIATDCRDAHNTPLISETFAFLPASAAGIVGPASQVLASMGEPILWCGDVPDSYRLTWIHSFSSHPAARSHWPPTMVRMSHGRGVWTSTVVQLASLINRKEVVRRTRSLSGNESREMLLAIGAFGPWKRNDFAQDPNVDDGAMWVIEARLAGRYHPIILVNADREAIDRLAAVFWRLGGLDPQMLHQGVELPES